MARDYFSTAISRHVWEAKYRHRDREVIYDQTIEDTWRRVAPALASIETRDRDTWEERFYRLLEGFKFLPGGRILAGAGTGRRVTLFNCFVMGVIEDSIDGIFTALRESALTLQQGGGIGCDFSTLRPCGTPTHGANGSASGPLSFMRIWDSMCATVLSTGTRRGAMMATLRCDHPDIEAFIDAKREKRELRHFNLSVQITDAFIKAVQTDQPWPLVFPASQLGEAVSSGTDTVVFRSWSGASDVVPCRILRVVPARQLWDRLVKASYRYAEPGVLFIDRINDLNNLWYREQISALNPCGEIPLPPYGACNLGSINLTCFVDKPFTSQARIDLAAIGAAVSVAVRMLDNVISLSRFPLEQQSVQAQGARRIGLGITGLADALIMLGLHYGESVAREQAAAIMKQVCHTAYRSSVELAREKGAFRFFDQEQYAQSVFVRALPPDLQRSIAAVGIRNSHLTAIAPAGTISLLANNVSSGLEPVFNIHYTRRMRQPDGSYREYTMADYALRLWRARYGERPLPPYFVDAHNLPPNAHLSMQAAVQPYVDNAIAKTINIPEDLDFMSFESVYEQAYALGLKGCTTFRPNPVTGTVLATRGHQA